MPDKPPAILPLKTAIRALVAAVEVGQVNSEQRRLLEYAKQALGDPHELACRHENTFYEVGDVLVCQDCRAVLEPSSR